MIIVTLHHACSLAVWQVVNHNVKPYGHSGVDETDQGYGGQLFKIIFFLLLFFYSLSDVVRSSLLANK